jgi:hypothetical protein
MSQEYKIIPTHTIVDDHGNWLDTCLSLRDAHANCKDMGAVKSDVTLKTKIGNYNVMIANSYLYLTDENGEWELANNDDALTVLRELAEAQKKIESLESKLKNLEINKNPVAKKAPTTKKAPKTRKASK